MDILSKEKRGFALRDFFKKKLGGITLIELLVVIAIIGILASIILVGVIGMRKEAKDARIVSEMDQLRALIAFHRQNQEMQGKESYDGLYSDTGQIPASDMADTINDIGLQGGSCPQAGFGSAGGAVPYPKEYICIYENNFSYCAKVRLNSSYWWCMDSSSTAKMYASVSNCGIVECTYDVSGNLQKAGRIYGCEADHTIEGIYTKVGDPPTEKCVQIP